MNGEHRKLEWDYLISKKPLTLSQPDTSTEAGRLYCISRPGLIPSHHYSVIVHKCYAESVFLRHGICRLRLNLPKVLLRQVILFNGHLANDLGSNFLYNTNMYRYINMYSSYLLEWENGLSRLHFNSMYENVGTFIHTSATIERYNFSHCIFFFYWALTILLYLIIIKGTFIASY